MDVAKGAKGASHLLPAKRPVETPFTSSRYLPLCRAIKKSMNKKAFAWADAVERELLRDTHIFHKLDLDTFQQYVFEAKREGAPINYSLGVDDVLTRLYFCLTRAMVRCAKNWWMASR